jgi:thiol-disulfide isomerase/thioredoxin
MAKEQGQDIQGKLTFENRLTIDKWSGNPEFAAEAFALAAPEGAEKVNTLMELFGQRPSQQEEPHALLGKAAPAFDLPTLDGKSAKLSDWKDKIVILDFWATWCGPCRSAMPIIIDVANSFKGKGVQLYAVNIDEDAATIESFLNDEKLSVDVALDKAGKVAEEYLAAAIPQTVLIGKDGRVQVVHVGFSANLRETLTEQIEALLAGEDLAAKALQPEKDPNAEESAAAPAE